MVKKLATIGATAALFAASAMPVLAARPDYGEQPGYSKASDCGQGHGSFAYFGEGGTVHDVNGYDESDGVDDNVGNGAEGGVDGGTGDRNSAYCGNPQNENF